MALTLCESNPLCVVSKQTLFMQSRSNTGTTKKKPFGSSWSLLSRKRLKKNPLCDLNSGKMRNLSWHPKQLQLWHTLKLFFPVWLVESFCSPQGNKTIKIKNRLKLTSSCEWRNRSQKGRKPPSNVWQKNHKTHEQIVLTAKGDIRKLIDKGAVIFNAVTSVILICGNNATTSVSSLFLHPLQGLITHNIYASNKIEDILYLDYLSIFHNPVFCFLSQVLHDFHPESSVFLFKSSQCVLCQ